MTQEKQLLLKDLCARLPYGVKGRVYAETTKGEYDIDGDMIFYDSPFDVTLDTINTSTEEIHTIAIGNEDTVDFIEYQQTDGKPYTVDEFKPYLRPLSSMTEEEKKEFERISNCRIYGESFKNEDDGWAHGYFDKDFFCATIKFLLSHHIDIYGLIPKGLAIEVTEENNPY